MLGKLINSLGAWKRSAVADAVAEWCNGKLTLNVSG